MIVPLFTKNPKMCVENRNHNTPFEVNIPTKDLFLMIP